MNKSVALAKTIGITTVIALLLIAMLSMVMLSSCDTSTDDIDISEYKDDEIILKGLDFNSLKEVSITVGDLKELDCITLEAESTSDKIGTINATGPLLETLVESYEDNLNDYSKIRIYAKDDYDIKLDKEFLSENKVILAFGIDGEPLLEDSRPIRIIIPDSDSAYWIRMVNTIEFIR